MSKVASGIVLAGVAGSAIGTGFIIYDHYAKQNLPGASGVTIAQRITESVVGLPSALSNDPLTVQATKTPYLARANGVYINGSANSVDCKALQDMSMEILSGGDRIVPALASCETMTGNLRLACYNTNLFNMHAVTSQHAFRIGTRRQRYIDFSYGKASQVEGYRACMEYFKDWIERHCPNAMAPLRENNFNQFVLLWANAWGAPSYKSSIINGTVTDTFMERRYNRLVAAGLTNATAIGNVSR